MEVVRECWGAVGQFGRRILSWVRIVEVNNHHAGSSSGKSAALLVDDAKDHLDYHHLDPALEEEDDQCAICTELLSEGDILHLPCNDKHVFHVACMRQWATKSMTCPLDRKPIPPEALVKLSVFNNARLYTSLFLEEMISGASRYLVFIHIWHDFPVNLLSLAIKKCSSGWVDRIDQSLYGAVPEATPFPAWSRKPVLLMGKVTFHALLWTAYSSIGYTSLVFHYLIRRSVEVTGLRMCVAAIRLANVGYDYEETKQIVSKTKWSRFVRYIGFVLGLALVGREVRRGADQLASHALNCINERLTFTV